MTDNKEETTHEQPLVTDSEVESSQESNNIESVTLLKQNENIQFFIGRYFSYKDTTLVEKTQKSGRLAPVFGPPSKAREEKYIEKMLKKDRQSNRG